MKTETNVLDHGKVALVSMMGSDASICEAARTSYKNRANRVNSEQLKESKKDDRRLIRYMMRNEHHSPFEMAEMLFYIKAPIFVFRQMHRHRTASISEVSGRYTEIPDEIYTPTILRKQDTANKQGSGDGTIPHSIMSYDKAYTEYVELLNKGVAREMARMVMPLATYSEMYWKCDLRNILHFLKLRLSAHAQYETREVAKAIRSFVSFCFPITWEAFEDYTLNSVTLYKHEIDLLKGVLNLTNKLDTNGFSAREVKELNNKLYKLGLKQ